MAHRPNRRDVILGAGAAGLATGTGTTAASGSAAGTTAPGVGSALSGEDRTPATAWPAWASDVLVQASARAAPARPLSGAGSSFDADAMAGPLEQAITGDYEAGRVEMVDGWIMSRTEMALCRRHCSLAAWDTVAACRAEAEAVHGQRLFDLERRVQELTFLAGGRGGIATSAPGFRLERSGGTTIISGPTGRVFTVVPDFVAGYLDVGEVRGDDIVFIGWAVDERARREADLVLIFDGDRYVDAIVPGNDRPDVARALGIEGRHGFARTTRPALLGYTSDSRFSVFGLSTFGYASRLRPGASVAVPLASEIRAGD